MSRFVLLLVAVASLCGCRSGFDYSGFADGTLPLLGRVASLDSRLRELLGEAHPDSSRLSTIVDSIDALVGPASGTSMTDSGVLASIASGFDRMTMTPVLQPNDSDLVPSLAWERRRAGCVPLVLYWSRALASHGIQASPVFLPGHLVLSMPDGRLVETLRGGIIRARGFYDSVFRLADRPYYVGFRTEPEGVLASMLVQAGMLEWRAGNLAGAESAFEAAARICPGLPEAEGNLGLVLEQAGRPEYALEKLDLALRGDRLAAKAAAHRAKLESEGRTR